MSESILRKIQKLFDLASDADDEEAKTAILRARDLMAKHNISEDQIKEGGSVENHAEAKVISRFVKETKRSDLLSKLCSVVSTQFRCGYYNSRTKNRNALFIYGFERDVDIAEATFHYAFASMEYCSKRYRKKIKILNRRLSTTDANYKVKSYMLGYIEGLEDALQNQKEALIQEGYELAVITPVKVKEFREANLVVGRAMNCNYQDDAARNEGYQEGKKFTENIALEE
ncbi:DUF2786 domain-containing protein [Listeria booriae]|uniref:DUF2786 domain-containing protein n=1 Tax=Listeria booriae TaxID=1552123 RepID=A0A7X0XCZ3_9LIST|nr:DUF2786 domain-containing protein [Listeria booriae]MBC1491925.1 DUF2786 domain-containing protein [Listeria booriae]